MSTECILSYKNENNEKIDDEICNILMNDLQNTNPDVDIKVRCLASMVAVIMDFLHDTEFQLEELYKIIVGIILSNRFISLLNDYHDKTISDYTEKIVDKHYDLSKDDFIKCLEDISTYDDVFTYNYVKNELNLLN